MKQLTFNLQELDELDGCIEAFREYCTESYAALLVSVFTQWNDPEQIARLTGKIMAALPQAMLVGSTSSGGIVEGDLKMHSTVLSFMVFEETQVRVHHFTDQMDPLEAGEVFMAECQTMERLVGIEFLATLSTFNAKSFFGQLAGLPADVAVFGGGAHTYTAGEPIYVFTDETILDAGMIAVTFESSVLSIRVDSGLGWHPLGAPMQITSTHGDFIVRELDHMPATAVYEKYLKIYPNRHFQQHTLEFPLVLERDGVSLARLPDGYAEDGSLVFNADCHIGETVRLAYGDPNEILENTHAMQRNIMKDMPEAILVFSCVTRRIFLQEAVKYELCHYQDIAPTAGLYTHGEINRDGGNIQLLNMTLVTASFREGAARRVKREFPSPDVMALNDAMSLAQRLACFITVTAGELETANHQLSVLARQDRLTQLFNRGEIENVLKNFMAGMAQSGKKLSVIMLDLDNFKSINDTYGHETGDIVLKTTARVIKECVRQSDAAGRWGGEEFLIVLKGADLENAAMVAERIRQRLAEEKLLPGRRVTGSFGVAEAQPEEEYLEFYQRLDRQLYLAKERGKNCVAY